MEQICSPLENGWQYPLHPSRMQHDSTLHRDTNLRPKREGIKSNGKPRLCHEESCRNHEALPYEVEKCRVVWHLPEYAPIFLMPSPIHSRTLSLTPSHPSRPKNNIPL